MKVLVAGGGGAIGGYLVKTLLDQGHDVRSVDIKPISQWWQVQHKAHNYSMVDLSKEVSARAAVEGAEWVFDLAENMGGIGYIESNRIGCAESIEIGINLLRASAQLGIKRFFFSSSACVYPTHLQTADLSTGVSAVRDLAESDAWPARPEEGYGFSKLYMEELCRHYQEELGMETRVARYHNVYGPHSSWNDGKEKSPAAICRKVAEAVHTGTNQIEVWGTGRQVRSYLHVKDCVAGTITLMESDHREPINIGTEDAVTIDQLISITETVAGVRLERRYDLDAAIGVASRNADISAAKKMLGWSPQISLEDGIDHLYSWISRQVSGRASADTSPRTATTEVPA